MDTTHEELLSDQLTSNDLSELTSQTASLKPSHKNRNATAIIAVILLLIITVSVLAYFNDIQPKNQRIISPTESIGTPLEFATDTSNWQSYTNEEYGFEFKYPGEYKIWEKFPLITEISPAAISLVKNSREVMLFTVSPANKSNNGQNIAETDSAILDEYRTNIQMNNNNVQTNSVFIGDEEALEVIRGDGTKMESSGMIPDIWIGPKEYFLVINGLLYSIEYYSENPDLFGTFDQILSTFRFTNQEVSSDISDWQTYTNNTIKYKIKIPREYEVAPPTDEEISLYGGKDNHVCIRSVSDKKCQVFVNVYKDIDIYNNQLPRVVVERGVLDSGFKYTITEGVLNDYKTATLVLDNSTGASSNITIAHPKENLFVELGGNPLYFNQIISSFRFVDNKTDTSKWKMYRDTSYNFEIKYPQNWVARQLQDSNDISTLRLSPINEIAGPGPWPYRLELFIGGCAVESSTCGVGQNSYGGTKENDTLFVGDQAYKVDIHTITNTKEKVFSNYAFQFALNNNTKNPVYITAHYFSEEQLDEIKHILLTYKKY